MYWFASYRRVLRACALVPDVDILPDKDRTELGDKVARCLIIGTCCNVCFANWHSFLFRLHYIQNFSGIAIQNRSGVPTKCYREWSWASQKVQFQVYVLNQQCDWCSENAVAGCSRHQDRQTRRRIRQTSFWCEVWCRWLYIQIENHAIRRSCVTLATVSYLCWLILSYVLCLGFRPVSLKSSMLCATTLLNLLTMMPSTSQNDNDWAGDEGTPANEEPQHHQCRQGLEPNIHSDDDIIVLLGTSNSEPAYSHCVTGLHRIMKSAPSYRHLLLCR